MYKKYYIDTHCHLNCCPDKKQKEVIERAQKYNVQKIITVTCNLEQIGQCLPITDQYDFIWTTAGIHPTDLTDNIERDLERIFEYAKNEEKIVAIGETGLDYYHDRFPHDLQAAFFVGQLNIAKQLNKPAILHCRGGKKPGENEQAFIDLIYILEQAEFSNGVVHCFSGNKIEARKILDLGLMLSFTGIATYPENEELHEVIAETPLNNMMLETDAPYISTESHRKEAGEPAFVTEIAETIADIKGVPIEEVIQITTENAERLFGI